MTRFFLLVATQIFIFIFKFHLAWECKIFYMDSRLLSTGWVMCQVISSNELFFKDIFSEWHCLLNWNFKIKASQPLSWQLCLIYQPNSLALFSYLFQDVLKNVEKATFYISFVNLISLIFAWHLIFIIATINR